tara:strand:- start:917 stop:1453 length:537 start_codon:yes stop_codon:yes gene_type:complete
MNYTEKELNNLINLNESDKTLGDELFKPMRNKVFNFLNKRKEDFKKHGFVIIYSNVVKSHTCNDIECLKSTVDDLLNDQNKNSFIVDSTEHKDPIGKDIIRCHNCNSPVSRQIRPTVSKINNINELLDLELDWKNDKEFITYLYALYNDFKIRKSYNLRYNFKHCVKLTNRLIKLIDE